MDTAIRLMYIHFLTNRKLIGDRNVPKNRAFTTGSEILVYPGVISDWFKKHNLEVPACLKGL